MTTERYMTGRWGTGLYEYVEEFDEWAPVIRGGVPVAAVAIPIAAAAIQAYGGISSARAAGKQTYRNRAFVRQQIARALAELTPEKIQELFRLFMPQIQSQLGPQLATSQEALRGAAARRGLLESPGFLSVEAGQRSQFANNASTQAFQNAMGLASQRSGVYRAAVGATMPGSTESGTGNALQALAGGFNNALLAAALSRPSQQSQSTPFGVPRSNIVGSPGFYGP